MEYVLVGDYYIPDLKLPNEERPIGKYGRNIIHSIDILFAFHKLDLDLKIFVTSRLTGVVVV